MVSFRQRIAQLVKFQRRLTVELQLRTFHSSQGGLLNEVFHPGRGRPAASFGNESTRRADDGRRVAGLSDHGSKRHLSAGPPLLLKRSQIQKCFSSERQYGEGYLDDTEGLTVRKFDDEVGHTRASSGKAENSVAGRISHPGEHPHDHQADADGGFLSMASGYGRATIGLGDVMPNLVLLCRSVLHLVPRLFRGRRQLIHMLEEQSDRPYLLIAQSVLP